MYYAVKRKFWMYRFVVMRLNVLLSWQFRHLMTNIVTNIVYLCIKNSLMIIDKTKMKNWIEYLLFILITPFIMWGTEELLRYLNQQYLWNMSERAIRCTYIIIACVIGCSLAHYLSNKIKQFRKIE